MYRGTSFLFISRSVAKNPTPTSRAPKALDCVQPAAALQRSSPAATMVLFTEESGTSPDLLHSSGGGDRCEGRSIPEFESWITRYFLSKPRSSQQAAPLLSNRCILTGIALPPKTWTFSPLVCNLEGQTTGGALLRRRPFVGGISGAEPRSLAPHMASSLHQRRLPHRRFGALTWQARTRRQGQEPQAPP